MATLFYQSLKYYCTTALGFYFSKWEVHGADSIPEGPVIFVPNHQNAFLDAILVTCSSKKNPWFLTRANVFDNARAASFLGKMQMLPIYRFRDGFATLKKNEQVMDNVVRKLNQGQSILIFAEGSHNDRENLGQLQKGVARMAMAADNTTAVAIVPVGLRYESRTEFRTRVLVNFGAPIFFRDLEPGTVNEPDKIDALLTNLRRGLEPLMLHIESEKYDEKWNHLKKHRQYHDNLKDQLLSDQKIAASYPLPGPESGKAHTRSILRKIFAWYIKLNSLIPYFIIQKMILSKIKDPQFTGSVRFSAGMLLAPAFWILQALLIFLLTNSALVAITYFSSLLICVKWS